MAPSLALSSTFLYQGSIFPFPPLLKVSGLMFIFQSGLSSKQAKHKNDTHFPSQSLKSGQFICGVLLKSKEKEYGMKPLKFGKGGGGANSLD